MVHLTVEVVHRLKFGFHRDYDTNVIYVIRVKLVIRKIRSNKYQARRCKKNSWKQKTSTFFVNGMLTLLLMGLASSNNAIAFPYCESVL